jgi:hypothetical protein
MDNKVYFSPELIANLKAQMPPPDFRFPSDLELGMRNLEFFEEDGKKQRFQ